MRNPSRVVRNSIGNRARSYQLDLFRGGDNLFAYVEPFVFQDAFERPNGSVGNGWVEEGSGSFSIVNGKLHFVNTTDVIKYSVAGANFVNGAYRVVVTDFDPGAKFAILMGYNLAQKGNAVAWAFVATIEAFAGGYNHYTSVGFNSSFYTFNGLGSQIINRPYHKLTFEIVVSSGGDITTRLWDVSTPSLPQLLSIIVRNTFIATTSVTQTIFGLVAYGVPSSDIGTVIVYDHDNAAATWSSLTIAKNDAALYYSKGGWVNGVAVNPGSYVKFKFTGTRIALVVDGSGNGLAATQWVSWEIDGVRNSKALAFNVGATFTGIELTLAIGLIDGTHTCKIWYGRAHLYDQDRWNTPVTCLKINSIKIDSGKAVSAATLKPKHALFYGDSITETAVSSSETDGFSYQCWPQLLADQINAEHSQIGFSYQGYTNMLASTNVPKGSTSYTNIYSGQARTISPSPDYVFLNWGRNDVAVWGASNATITADATTVITGLRGTYPSSKLFIIIPFSQDAKVALTDAYNNWMAGHVGDTVYLVDLGSAGQQAVTLGTYSDDGVHPNTAGNQYVVNLIYTAIQANL